MRFPTWLLTVLLLSLGTMSLAAPASEELDPTILITMDFQLWSVSPETHASLGTVPLIADAVPPAERTGPSPLMAWTNATGSELLSAPRIVAANGDEARLTISGSADGDPMLLDLRARVDAPVGKQLTLDVEGRFDGGEPTSIMMPLPDAATLVVAIPHRSKVARLLVLVCTPTSLIGTQPLLPPSPTMRLAVKIAEGGGIAGFDENADGAQLVGAKLIDRPAFDGRDGFQEIRLSDGDYGVAYESPSKGAYILSLVPVKAPPFGTPDVPSAPPSANLGLRWRYDFLPDGSAVRIDLALLDLPGGSMWIPLSEFRVPQGQALQVLLPVDAKGVRRLVTFVPRWEDWHAANAKPGS